jgi:hypothetical protein
MKKVKIQDFRAQNTCLTQWKPSLFPSRRYPESAPRISCFSFLSPLQSCLWFVSFIEKMRISVWRFFSLENENLQLKKREGKKAKMRDIHGRV